MFGFIVALGFAICLAIAGGLFFTIQANFVLSAIYILLFVWGMDPRNREGLPGVLGHIATTYSVVCLVLLWGTFYFATGQTLIQDLFSGFNIQILR